MLDKILKTFLEDDHGDIQFDIDTVTNSAEVDNEKYGTKPNKKHDDLENNEKSPNKQGIIRTVDGAHLVYKRQTEEGTYEELWIYNIDNDIHNELEIKQNIIAATDIPSTKTESEDGNQEYTLTTLGNAQLLHITGLPN